MIPKRSQRNAKARQGNTRQSTTKVRQGNTKRRAKRRYNKTLFTRDGNVQTHIPCGSGFVGLGVCNHICTHVRISNKKLVNHRRLCKRCGLFFHDEQCKKSHRCRPDHGMSKWSVQELDAVTDAANKVCNPCKITKHTTSSMVHHDATYCMLSIMFSCGIKLEQMCCIHHIIIGYEQRHFLLEPFELYCLNRYNTYNSASHIIMFR
jgi:hypothetical protein